MTTTRTTPGSYGLRGIVPWSRMPRTTTPAQGVSRGLYVGPSLPIPTPNQYDVVLQQHHELVAAAEVKSPIRRTVWYEHPDGRKMPRQAQEWRKVGTAVTPDPAVPGPGGWNQFQWNSNGWNNMGPWTVPGDTVVLDFIVPTGYRGMLYGVTFYYGGTGFVSGSGDIIWRLKVGNAWAKGMGQCLYAFGQIYQCLDLTDCIQLWEHQRVTAYVNVPNLSGLIQIGASYVGVVVQGWWYPMREGLEMSRRLYPS